VPTVGNTRRDVRYETGADYGNVVADTVSMPERGWITSFRVNFGGFAAQLRARLCVWKWIDLSLLYQSEERILPSGAAWHAVSNLSIPFDREELPLLGFWRDKDQRSEFYAQTQPARHLRVSTHTGSREAPDPLPAGDFFEHMLCRELTYTKQERPLVPVFLDPTPDEGGVGNLSLTVKCTLPHGDDAEHDFTTRVQAYLYDEDAESVFYDAVHEVPEGAGEFEATIPGLLPTSKPFRLLVRHQDYWGAWSEWRRRDFTSSAGPDAPTVIGPLGRITAQKPAEFRFGYSNPLGSAYASTEIEIWDRRRRSRLRASGAQAGTLAGTDRVVGNAWMANLPWGTAFSGRARHRDAAGNVGGWRWFDFQTNSAPRVPFSLSPAGGRVTPNKVLSCRLSDPENDPITAVDYRVYQKSNNALVASGQMTISPDGKSASVDPPGLLSDVPYKWDARASDGSPPSPSAYSAQQEFTWSPVPEAVLLLPDETTPRNLVEDPSFEYASNYWTAENHVAGVNEAARVQDALAYRGGWRMAGTVRDPAQGSPIRRGAFMAVDAARPYYFGAALMRDRLQPPAATHFGVACHDAGGALLGTLYPGDLPQGTDPGTSWAERDGFVGPASGAGGYPTSFPAGTTQARLFFEPSRGAASEASLDAVQARRLPQGLAYSQATDAKRWLGYFDGDTASLKTLSSASDVPDFAWELVTGSSASRGINVLEYPQASLVLSYASVAGSLKSNDRLYVEQWLRDRWQPIHDSGWTGGGRTTIPLPSGLLRNDQYYRLKLEARDSAATPRVGSTDWVVFQTAFQGPPAPEILEAAGDDSAGSLRLRWERTALSQLAFGGYEVGIAPYGETEPATVLELITAPEKTDFEWHEPVSGERYFLMVREVENVGGEQLQGDWSRASARAEFRTWFLKSLHDPTGIKVAFEVMAEDVVTFDYPAAETQVWLWGASRPSYYVEPADQAAGTVIVRLERGDPLLGQKEAALKDIRRLRRFGVILQTTDPNEAYHMHVSTIAEEYSDVPWHSTWTLGLKQMAWESDYYLREGLVRS
jgi:hypothetical protein